MQKSDTLDVVARIERLERANRRLTLLSCGLLLLPVFGIAGWQDPALTVPDVLKVKRLEVIDQRGVPMVTLSTGRNDEGGAMTLRDKNGERRAWWTSNPDGSNLALVREADIKADGSTTAGMSVSKSSAEMTLLSPNNAMFSTSVRDDKPRMELYNTKGVLLFSAPWKTK